MTVCRCGCDRRDAIEKVSMCKICRVAVHTPVHVGCVVVLCFDYSGTILPKNKVENTTCHHIGVMHHPRPTVQYCGAYWSTWFIGTTVKKGLHENSSE